MGSKKAVVRRRGRTRVHWPERVVVIRARTGMSQKEFAKLVGVSVDTLQNWEQGRRQPAGPSAVLIRVIETDPEAVMRALR